ncbi:ketopantoate reductase family protein [Shewanella pneumatophori]|uniref:2-dehydropantoate 2-reductase n=1 Tax=Shewanella pneumatophori TaxID=314092 RepID=A0A9X1Z9W6_9GAMM|nr:2-dehydropantoate 2-reductase [Shewanella pneumatophori]MCL1138369.1 2-dehydropantoate 2-reductase [Shewanella pneumatophori]
MPTQSIKKSALIKICILGAGAIGQLIYHQLAEQSQSQLSFISRDAFSSVQSLHFTTLDEQIINRKAALIGQADYQTHLSQIDLLIVCVKAYQVSDALKPILPLLSTSTHILLLHNGMGPHLEVISLLKGRGLSLGTTSQGALKLDKWQVKQTGSGLTQLGSSQVLTQLPQLPVPLKQLLLTAIPHSNWYSEILPLLWQKLAVNLAINPLTAIFNCPNGELAADKYNQVIADAVSELVGVAKHDGIELDLDVLLQRVYQVIELTANNFSSMHQDVQHQRKTEIDAINGFVLQRAAVHQLKVPVNQSLLQQIKQIEAKYE